MGSHIDMRERRVNHYIDLWIVVYPYYYFYVILGESTKEGKEEQLSAKGRQVITLNLAITLRVTLVAIFKILSHPLYIYIIFEMLFLYKIG